MNYDSRGQLPREHVPSLCHVSLERETELKLISFHLEIGVKCIKFNAGVHCK